MRTNLIKEYFEPLIEVSLIKLCKYYFNSNVSKEYELAVVFTLDK